MQRMGFLKQVQQKNEQTELRKLSLQNVSTNLNHQEKVGFIVEPPSYHSQMPAFINRKVKNLKPYTNHFKRFNVQASKIQQIGTKNTEVNKLIKVTLQNQKAKVQKTNVLKELGIEKQIKPSEIPYKLSEISVYNQFLQKTNALFSSNVIESMYQQYMKKNQKYTKQAYQRSHRISQSKQIKQGKQRNLHARHQRRSMGEMNEIIEADEIIDEIPSPTETHSVKSVNKLPKTQQGALNTQIVCITPNLADLKNDDLILNQGLKYVASLKNKKISNAQTAESVRRETVESIHASGSKKVILPNVIPNQFEEKRDSGGEKLLQRDRVCSSPVQNAISSPIKSSIEAKLSPFKQIKFPFTLNIGSKQLKQPQKPPQTQQIQFIKSQKEVTTINVDKTKLIKSCPPDVPLPTNITASSYIVYEPSFSQNQNLNSYEENITYTNKIFGNQRILASLNCKTVVEIASLTKIMTFVLALEICENLKIDSTVEKVRIGKFEANINGTSAEISQGEIYTVEQLFYGLMLPSGNDASLALATWGGKKMLIREIKQKEKIKKKSISQSIQAKTFAQTEPVDLFISRPQNQKIVLKKKKCYDRFILQMNKKARNLGMAKTTYANSHGLSNNLNKSCAFDLCILCEYAMINEKFKKVISTISYQSTILYEDLQQEDDHEFLYNSKKKFAKYSKNKRNDDIEHNNQHSDEQSSEQLQQKQYIFSERQKQFYNSQTNFARSQREKDSTPSPRTYKTKQICWQFFFLSRENTHKLLSRQDYVGIKTGITNTAGPCLASCIKTPENRFFIIIVLNSKKLNYRFKDTETLRKWIYKRQGIAPIKLQKPQTQSSMAYFKDEALEDPNYEAQDQTTQPENPQ